MQFPDQGTVLARMHPLLVMIAHSLCARRMALSCVLHSAGPEQMEECEDRCVRKAVQGMLRMLPLRVCENMRDHLTVRNCHAFREQRDLWQSLGSRLAWEMKVQELQMWEFAQESGSGLLDCRSWILCRALAAVVCPMVDWP